MKTNLPQVAIVGRANVGKSTLFNRLIEKNKALTASKSGTTRDRNIDIVNWRDRQFTLIDTGGLDVTNKQTDIIDSNIIKQAEIAIKQADLILFVVDVKAGLTPTDKNLARLLIKRGLKNKIILIGNKADSLKWKQDTGDLYSLSLDEPQMVSAVNGSGCGDMLDVLIKRLPKAKPIITQNQPRPIKVAIVGKPNAGKSSLLNSILGEERVIVTDTPHTTRESHDTEFEYQDHNFILIDTAGIRKQHKIVRGTLEKKSVDRSTQAIKEADVVILVTEASKKISSQDKKISQIILENSKSVVIVANKWDLIPDKDTHTIDTYREYYQANFDYLWWAPLIFISALNNKNTKKILDLVLEIKKARETTLSDKQLDNFLNNRIKKQRPQKGKGIKNPYIYTLKQVGINPPRFLMAVNDPLILHFSYIRYIQNSLREKFNIIGTPIQIELEKWQKKD